MAIKKQWLSWEELIPYKEQLIDLELGLMIRYHYPDWDIPRSYPEERVNNLESYLNNGSTFIWGVIENDILLGYYWGYVSLFIDRKRWNLRSIMFRNEAKGRGYGTEAIKVDLEKAKELGCDEAVTEYVTWNKAMEVTMLKMGYIPTRIEVLKKL